MDNLILTEEQYQLMAEKLAQAQTIADLLAQAYGPGGAQRDPDVQRSAEVCSHLVIEAHAVLAQARG